MIPLSHFVNHIPDLFRADVVVLCGSTVGAIAAPATCSACIEIAADNRPVYWSWLPPTEPTP